MLTMREKKVERNVITDFKALHSFFTSKTNFHAMWNELNLNEKPTNTSIFFSPPDFSLHSHPFYTALTNINLINIEIGNNKPWEEKAKNEQYKGRKMNYLKPHEELLHKCLHQQNVDAVLPFKKV
ncbi:CLUMA_CG021065, isoform A [Clunio marinus]|uniref:CLUMA_CG021065, isoform A n=1 Tax=Clunio marinus TaxID=568069 RepID=A0A1J1J776_9DIPT|nr:CLUMA_CG021065, isoform A [Clunio marinus]